MSSPGTLISKTMDCPEYNKALTCHFAPTYGAISSQFRSMLRYQFSGPRKPPAETTCRTHRSRRR
jgi:hypothetical protein